MDSNHELVSGKKRVNWSAVRRTIYTIVVYILGAVSIKISIWATLLIFITLFIIPKIIKERP